MHAALDILALVAVVGFVAGFARRLGWSEPLALVVVGIGLSFVPHLLEIHAHPRSRPHRAAAAAALRRRDPHLAGRLPGQPSRDPAAVRRAGGVLDRRRSASSRGGSCPGITAAAGFALGAVVAPPDAVAATTVARRVGHAAPHRVDPRGREPGERRDRAGRAQHRDRGDHRVGDGLARRRGTSSRAAGGGVLVGLVAAYRAGAGPPADQRPGARHHAVVRGAVRRVPARRGDQGVRRARRRGHRPDPRPQVAGAAVGAARASPRTSTGARCSSCSRTWCSC